MFISVKMRRVVECIKCGHKFKSSVETPRCSECGARRCRDVAPTTIELDEDDAARLEELRKKWDMTDSTNQELASELIRKADPSSSSWEVDVSQPENVEVESSGKPEDHKREDPDPFLLIAVLLIIMAAILDFLL